MSRRHRFKLLLKRIFFLETWHQPWELRKWRDRTWLETRVLPDGDIIVGRCWCGWVGEERADRDRASWDCGYHTGLVHRF